MEHSEKEETSVLRDGREEKEGAETAVKIQGQAQREQGQEEADAGKDLDEIQAQIKLNEERLKQISEQKKKLDVNSEEYLALEDERRTLRKELVDLDYSHKRIFKIYKKQKAQVQEREKIEKERKFEEEQNELKRHRDEERLQRSRRLEQQLEEISQSSKKRREELDRLNEKNVKEEERLREEYRNKAELEFDLERSRIKEAQARQTAIRLRQVELDEQLILRSQSPYHYSRFSLYSPYIPYIPSLPYVPYRLPLYPLHLSYRYFPYHYYP